MNMLDMYKKLDAQVRSVGAEKASQMDVVISTNDESIGPRSFVEFNSIMFGFDWEAGQLRIEPVKPVFMRPKVEKVRRMVTDNKYWCERCASKVGKSDKYCKSCGVQLKDS